MEISHSAQFLQFAFARRFAYPAFNVWNLELGKALVQAATEEEAPVILQTFYGDLHYSGSAEMSAATHAVIAGSPLPILLHLDLRTACPCWCAVCNWAIDPLCSMAGLCRWTRTLPQASKPRRSDTPSVQPWTELGQFGGEHQAGTVTEANPDDCERLRIGLNLS
jgi:hypothetical protein